MIILSKIIQQKDSLGEHSSCAGSSASSTSTRLRMLKTLFATLVFCMSPTPSVALLGVVLRSIVDSRTILDSKQGGGLGDLTSSHRRHRNRAIFAVGVVSRIFVRATLLTTYTIECYPLINKPRWFFCTSVPATLLTLWWYLIYNTQRDISDTHNLIYSWIKIPSTSLRHLTSATLFFFIADPARD